MPLSTSHAQALKTARQFRIHAVPGVNIQTANYLDGLRTASRVRVLGSVAASELSPEDRSSQLQREAEELQKLSVGLTPIPDPFYSPRRQLYQQYAQHRPVAEIHCGLGPLAYADDYLGFYVTSTELIYSLERAFTIWSHGMQAQFRRPNQRAPQRGSIDPQNRKHAALAADIARELHDEFTTMKDEWDNVPKMVVRHVRKQTIHLALHHLNRGLQTFHHSVHDLMTQGNIPIPPVYANRQRVEAPIRPNLTGLYHYVFIG